MYFIVKEYIKYISWDEFCQELVAGAGVVAGAYGAGVDVDTVLCDVEILFDCVVTITRGLDGIFGEREVDVAEFNASFDAGVHIVGATGGVDGDLNVLKVGDCFTAIGLATVSTGAAVATASFGGVIAKFDGESGSWLTVRKRENEEEGVAVASAVAGVGDGCGKLDRCDASKDVGKTIFALDSLGLVIVGACVTVVVGADDG